MSGRVRGMSGGRRMGYNRGKGSVSRGLRSVNRDALRERNLLEATESSFFEC